MTDAPELDGFFALLFLGIAVVWVGFWFPVSALYMRKWIRLYQRRGWTLLTRLMLVLPTLIVAWFLIKSNGNPMAWIILSPALLGGLVPVAWHVTTWLPERYREETRSL